MRQLPWRLDSKAALGFLLILATFSLVGWLYLTQASAVTTTSYRIDELRMELDRLKNQNAALKLEIARLEALSRVETRARELGFSPTTNVRYLAVDNYPVTTDEVETLAYSDTTIPLNANAQAGGTDFEPSTWWLTLLDNVAAWVAKE
jgi:cell division protein FtsL